MNINLLNCKKKLEKSQSPFVKVSRGAHSTVYSYLESTELLYILLLIIINTQMVAVALGPWASHSEDRAEP